VPDRPSGTASSAPDSRPSFRVACQSYARVTIADSEGATARGCPRHASPQASDQDVEALALMLDLAEEIDTAIAEAVMGLHARGSTATGGQRAQVKVPGERTREVTLDPGDLCGHSGQKPRARPEPVRTGRGPSPARCVLTTGARPLDRPCEYAHPCRDIRPAA